MPYVKTVWVNGTAPALNDSNLNKIEQGIFDSLRQDGSTTMSGQLVTTAGTAATPAIAPTGNSNTGIFFPAANSMGVTIDGSERVRFKSNGFVGVGDLDPSYRLDVVSYASTPLRVQRSGEYGEVIKIGRAGVTDTAGISYPADGTFQITTAATPRMTINASGNVGIGTTSPASKLEVSGLITRTVTVDGSTGSPAEESGIQYRHPVSASNRAGINFFNTYANNGAAWLSFLTTNTSNSYAERMRIDAAGNVGIGATSPADKLHVEGNIYLGTANRTIYTAGTGTLTLQTGTGSFTIARNNAADTSLRIDSSGNVGIGINAPTSQLHVYNNGSVASLMVETNTTGGDSKIALKTNGTGGRHWYWQTGDNTSGLNGRLRLWDSTASAERLTVTDAGFLGIGVVPNAELHIKGTGEIMRLETTAATGDNFIRFYAPSSVTKGFIGYTSSGNDHLNINNVLSADLLFHTNNIERLRIESGGTTRPAANNTYDLGNSSFRWATIYAQNALNTSDARLKTDVQESSLGLDFIAALNPVQFRYIEGGNTVERVQTGTKTVEITPAIPAQPEVLDEEGNVIQEVTEEVPAITEERPTFETVVTPREGVRTHFGLLAQEVKAALPDGLDFAGWALADKEDAESTQFLGYAELIAPMIKAIQELNAKVEALEAQIANQ